MGSLVVVYLREARVVSLAVLISYKEVMLSPSITLVALSVLCVLLLLVIPILDSVPKLAKFISLRWVCVAIPLLLMTAVVLDCSHLAESTRNYLVIGGLILTGVFILVRTIEKVLFNGWLKGVNLKTQVKKGDITFSADISTPLDNSNIEVNINQ